MWIINLLTGLFLFLLGLVTKIFRLSCLISGYNTASKEEKEKYDEDRLINYVSGLVMISSVILILACPIGLAFGELETQIMIVSWSLFTLFIIGGLVYLNTGNRLKK